MSTFDTPTLIIVTAITLTLTSSAILISWIVNRRMPGANHWSQGYLLIATGVLLQATQQYLHPAISIALANHIIVTGFYLCWMGARIFQEKNSHPLIYFIILQSALLMAFMLTGLESSGLADRTILMSAILAALSFLIANELIRHQTQKSLSNTITGITFALLALAFVARGISIEMLPQNGNILTAGKHSHITYLFAIVFNIPIAFGFILMLSERLENRLKQLADTDFLTGLHSRRAIVNSAERLISRYHQGESHTALLMMDLDKFKKVNDTYGHLAGDAILCHFAKTMRQCLRPNDLIGRMGGEEFIAILANTSFSDATAAAERLRSAFESEPTRFNDQMIDATVSIGIATTEYGANNFNKLFTEADLALYHAKGSGRNCISSHTSTSEIAVEGTIR